MNDNNTTMTAMTESLSRFLSDESYKVAIIKGAWGTGKTYFWRHFFQAKRKDLNFRAYSYVSLFGVKEVRDVKKQIFSNLEIMDDKKNEWNVGKLKHLSTILSNISIPYVASASAISDLIEDKTIENFLICFDDLERKEEGVSTSSILGLISNLKEERNCKILLIYNDKEIDAESKKAIDEYREKVVDLELCYAPSIENNLSLVWPENCPGCVMEIFKKLELNNIRIMQRVKYTHEYFKDSIDKKFTHLSTAFQYKSTLMTVLHHGFSEAISISDLVSVSFYALLMSKEKEKDKRWELIKKLNFLPEGFDQIIVDYLINGYVDIAGSEDDLSQMDNRYRLEDVSKKHQELWLQYYSNFTTSQETFIANQIQFLTAHVEDLSIASIASAVEFIQTLDSRKNLEDLLDRSIELFLTKNTSIDTCELQRLGLTKNAITKIQCRLAEKTCNYSMTELFQALAGSNGWNPRDIQHLKRFSEDEYFSWITTEKGEDVIDILANFLQRFGGNKQGEELVVEKIRAALEKVKLRSNLDKCRVERLIKC
jgi:hypothetical protein